MAKLNLLETKEQVALFEWAAYYPQLAWMHANLNGAYLHGNKLQRAIQWAKLKAQGAKVGILDVFLPLPVAPYHGLYIEMKRSDGKGRLTLKQKEFRDYAELQGYKCVVCEGTKAAIEAIKAYAGIT